MNKEQDRNHLEQSTWFNQPPLEKHWSFSRALKGAGYGFVFGTSLGLLEVGIGHDFAKMFRTPGIVDQTLLLQMTFGTLAGSILGGIRETAPLPKRTAELIYIYRVAFQEYLMKYFNSKG
ncbi:hypothetical protein M1563_03875 [Patescibacteria group bacterium]|nr:hypothetical protein [Patescibacteria group bacterium]MCL5409569.1 hypothetical protein [Patescibacteria group bacterium]